MQVPFEYIQCVSCCCSKSDSKNLMAFCFRPPDSLADFKQQLEMQHKAN